MNEIPQLQPHPSFLQMNFKTIPSSSRRIWNYDVFLSFNAEDTSNDFTSYLYFALLILQVKTLINDKKKQDYCSPTLLEAIEESRISIVVFSRNYAASIGCLEELAKIARSIDSVQQFVCPVFYDVDQSEVRFQTGAYRRVFDEHVEKFRENLVKVERWRNAMTKVANLPGLIMKNQIKTSVLYDIVRTVKYILRQEASSFIDELLGIQPQVEALENLLDLASYDVIRIIGTCGKQGSAMATVASVLYHRISPKFDALCFLDKVSRASTRWEGVCCLQEQLLHETLHQKNLNKTDVNQQGISLTAARLRNLKILIVVDDVCHILILEELAGNRDWFGAGNRIIITTRDEHILKMFTVDETCRVKLLNNEEAHELFTLQALGDIEKEIFLDVACFFVGEEMNNVMEILCGCEFYPLYEIEALVKKSLMTISGQVIQMHYMLQELGQEAIKLEFPQEPGKRSRLWFDEDFRHVIETNTATGNIKALVLNPKVLQVTPLRVDALSKMNGLKLLIIRNVNFSGVLNDLSNHLQYALWHRFPYTVLPSSFEPHKLVQLIMPESNITQLWKELKTTLPHLRRMDLHGSKNLRETPDFEKLPNLEKLDFEGCTRLVLLDPSIACLRKLKFLNLRNCTSLESLPNNLFGLSSIEILNVAGCSKFAEYLDFDNRKSSIEEEVLSNQDLPSLEEIENSLLAYGIHRGPVNSSTEDSLNSNDEYVLEKECMNCRLRESIHKGSQDDLASKIIEHIIRSRNCCVQFSDCTKKSARSISYEVEATASRFTRNESTIAKCVVALNEIDGVPNNFYLKALEKFQDPYWREVFLLMPHDRKKAWLDSLV